MIQERYNKNNEATFTIDELHNLYSRGVQEGIEHKKPSEGTLTLIESMNDKIDKLKDDMLTRITEIKILITRLPQDLIDKCDRRYADKTTEKKVDGLNKEINAIRNQGNNRLWDIFKIILEILIAIMLGVLLTKVK